jgi:hypothetical protein
VPSRQARLVLVAIAVCLVLTVPAGRRETTSAGSILLEGDSLAVGVAPYLRRDLPESRLVVRARVGGRFATDSAS